MRGARHSLHSARLLFAEILRKIARGTDSAVASASHRSELVDYMATLSASRLMALLQAALPGASVMPTATPPKPALFNVPDIGPVQFYLWTTTPDQSAQGRPIGEHKSQIIIPGTERGSRQHFALDAAPTFLMGFSPLLGVYVGWQAALHQDAGYSKNLQVPADLLEAANRDGWAVDQRGTGNGPEVRVAFHPSHLVRYVTTSIEADTKGLSGDARELFFKAKAPAFDSLDISAKASSGKPVTLAEIERERVVVAGTRLKREAGFAKKVLAAFGHRCAVCELQLSILDGAHIVPVHHPQGSDELWNGLALCKNHHALFDRRILLIDPQIHVRADDETLGVLAELGQIGGIDAAIGAYRDQPLKRPPDYFGNDEALTAHLQEALKVNYEYGPA